MKKNCLTCKYAIGQICTWGQNFATPKVFPEVMWITDAKTECYAWDSIPEETPNAQSPAEG